MVTAAQEGTVLRESRRGEKQKRQKQNAQPYQPPHAHTSSVNPKIEISTKYSIL
jgi:hypothetical protein